MNGPSRAQVKVLRSLQNQTVSLNAMVAKATLAQKQTGERPPQWWFEDYHGRAILHAELTQAAHAAGVPQAWIDHVDERGRRGVAWRADLFLRTPEGVDWDRILGDLDRGIRRLQGWAALDAACTQIDPANAYSGSIELDRNLTILYGRTAGIANLFGLTADHGAQLWGDALSWAHAGAAELDGNATEGLIHRWQAAAHTNLDQYGLQSLALAAAGIDTDTCPALPSLAQLSTALDQVLEPIQPLFRTAETSRAAIESAASAANLTVDADTENPAAGTALSFSNAPRTEDWSPDPDADADIPAPEFLPPNWGAER